MPAAAQQHHAPLAIDETLSFHAIVENTLAHIPEAREMLVRDQQAQAYTAAGNSWIAGRPSLALNYYNDNGFDNTGQVETEYGVQMPLWRPGERNSSQQLGKDYQQQATLWKDALGLDVAGRVRTSLADLDETAALLAIERDATATAADVLRVTTAQFDAGAVARLDVMQAENLLLEQRKRELAAGAAVVDAEISYTLLTGLSARPAVIHSETQSQQMTIDGTHPLLRYLESEVAIADGALRQSEIAAKGNPQLTVGSRRERGDRFTPYTDSMNLSVTIPFGGRAFVSSRTSDGRRAKVDAEVRHISTLRALTLALHNAEHDLSVMDESLPLAQRQADLSAERRDLAQAAFSTGELTLAQVLSAVQEARVAARELTLLQLQQQRLVAEFNQLVGVMP